jgi:hypothetical protein
VAHHAVDSLLVHRAENVAVVRECHW